jgi:ABC-type proline/glycine betaine transport system permease subunit
MYVMYTLILSSIPMGVLFAFKPDVAQAVTVGFKAWLEAIPSDMIALFGVGYVGYVGARTVEKIKK